MDKAGARLYAPLRSHAAEVAGGPELVDRQLVLAVEWRWTGEAAVGETDLLILVQ